MISRPHWPIANKKDLQTYLSTIMNFLFVIFCLIAASEASRMSMRSVCKLDICSKCEHIILKKAGTKIIRKKCQLFLRLPRCCPNSAGFISILRWMDLSENRRQGKAVHYSLWLDLVFLICDWQSALAPSLSVLNQHKLHVHLKHHKYIKKYANLKMIMNFLFVTSLKTIKPLSSVIFLFAS